MQRLWPLPILFLLGCDALWGSFNRPHYELAQASRSSTIAISEDDAVLVLVNPDHGSISVFDPASLRRTAVVPTGREPSSVVLHPDGDTAFVANRADATVVKITGIRSPTPQVVATVAVGSEPTGLALSPRGRRLFVAEFAESSIAVIETADLTVSAVIPNVKNPRTLAVTNNLDGQDEDELLVVPHYFGEPQAGGEGRNAGRVGRVDLYALRDLSLVRSILLPMIPAAVSGSDDAGPNQLGGAVIAPDGRLYVTDLAVSPAPPLSADHSVTPVVHVVDLVAGSEVTQGAATTSLARLLAQTGTASTLYLADPVDLEFVHTKKSVGFVGYVVSRGDDMVERMVFDPDKGAVSIGSMQNLQIDVSGDDQLGRCNAPIGGAVAFNSQRMFLNCWLSRKLAVVDLMNQNLQSTTNTVDAEPLSPSALSGRRAFYSARGRLSAAGRIACASCHPDGRSDGVTWVFPTGPRQTPALDNVFSHSTAAGSVQKQRILGWTANADEVADFEDKLRTVMGGHGAISTSTNACGDLTQETAVTLNAALGNPNRSLQQQAGSCSTTWDDIENYLTTLRPVRRLQRLDAAAVARGADLFRDAGQGGGCNKCHSEGGWTLSRRFYTPSMALLTSLPTVRFSRPAAWPSFYTVHDGGNQIEAQPAAAESPAMAISPTQVSCALRNVSTFGVASSAAIEVDSTGGRAQGRGGYNIPGLYSLAVSAPFLHHGQAGSLDALFSSSDFAAHLSSGAANFDLMDAGARSDLISFLLSLDADAPETVAPAGFSAGCATQ